MAIRGYVISGLLGVGKTTLVRRMVRDYGFRAPTTTTTRPVTEEDFALVQLSELPFIESVRSGELLYPIISGGTGYAWDTEAANLVESGQRISFATRPYTALTLSSIFPELVPIWLYANEETRRHRIAKRGDDRDSLPVVRAARELYDKADASYERLFIHRVEATGSEAAYLADLYDSLS